MRLGDFKADVGVKGDIDGLKDAGGSDEANCGCYVNSVVTSSFSKAE
jgi:hypothetical protein